jgi:hypothetical protein
LEFLARAIRLEEEIKGINIGKEEFKWSLFGDDMFLYWKDPKHSTKKILDIINTFNKVAEYKNQYTKIITLNKLRKNLGKQSHLQ